LEDSELCFLLRFYKVYNAAIEVGNLASILIALTLTLMAIQPSKPDPPLFCGGDVSEIPEVEASGGKYFYHGVEKDPFEIMKAAGWNLVRFRIWNNPKEGWCDKDHTLALAKRAAAHGLKISLDFHYSDWWADPGKQNKPAEWKSLSFPDLQKAVYEYTSDVVRSMVKQGTPPYMVQVGNEILGGMLWPEGKVDSDKPEQWDKLAKLLNAGFRGVRDDNRRHKILTMIHLDRGGDNKTAVWWFDHILKQKVQFDTIGLSYYPWWHGSLEAFQSNLTDLSIRYKKDLYVVEIAYPWFRDMAPGPHVYNGERTESGFAQTPEGQARFLSRVLDIIRSVPGGRGKGLLYWAPTWISTPKQHSPYANLAVFDEKGMALPAVDVLGGRRQ
jgi:arabinogalactan endo-1,4-beta-galactosidase